MTLLGVKSATGDCPDTASMDVQQHRYFSQEINEIKEDISRISKALNAFRSSWNLIGRLGGAFRR